MKYWVNYWSWKQWIKANVDEEEITLARAESLLKDINSKKNNKDEFRKNTTILLMI